MKKRKSTYITEEDFVILACWTSSPMRVCKVPVGLMKKKKGMLDYGENIWEIIKRLYAADPPHGNGNGVYNNSDK